MTTCPLPGIRRRGRRVSIGPGEDSVSSMSRQAVPRDAPFVIPEAAHYLILPTSYLYFYDLRILKILSLSSQ